MTRVRVKRIDGNLLNFFGEVNLFFAYFEQFCYILGGGGISSLKPPNLPLWLNGTLKRSV